jgi:hypothetical protein
MVYILTENIELINLEYVAKFYLVDSYSPACWETKEKKLLYFF